MQKVWTDIYFDSRFQEKPSYLEKENDSARNHRQSAPIMMDVSQCVRDVLVSTFKKKCGISDDLYYSFE